jgi:hypothetical protein
MKDAMQDQPANFVESRVALEARITPRRFRGDHNIAQKAV